jgi:GNAT superfamily N-acetyltransferase
MQSTRRSIEIGSNGDRPDAPRQLWPEDIERLYLEHHPRVDDDEAMEIVSRSPGSSFWLPATSEFILITPWRHRSELVTIHTLGAFANEDVLMRATMEHARVAGTAGFVVVDVNELRHSSFYARFGLEPFEKIITYEHRHPSHMPEIDDAGIEFRPITSVDRAKMQELIALDHASFPWFWWNSPEEFSVYLDHPGVEIWAGFHKDELVSYAGTTLYRRWGHLDRIATRPDLQGTGIGRATLAFALRRLVQRGGRRVALSTQADNVRSRALYEKMGFAHTPADDYSVFLAVFRPELISSGGSAGSTPSLRSTGSA